MIKKNEKQKGPDRVLLFTVMILVAVGLLMISSAGIVFGQSRFGDPYYFLKRQILFGLLPGAVFCFLASLIDYHRLQRFAVPIFITAIVCLILVFVPGLGITAYGARRWFGVGPLSFQPTEMMKLALIIYLSAWLAGRGQLNVRRFSEGFLPFLAILGFVGLLIYLQPDAGTLGVTGLIAFSIFFSAGANMTHILTFALLAIAGFYFMIHTAAYRMNRLMVFLNPEMDPLGKGYQINQALLAIGSGGLLGLGLGQSRQKFNYLPEPVTDSIYAVMGEELGFLGAAALIFLFCLFAYRGYRVAVLAPDQFGRLLAVGITTWISLQAFINVAAITGVVPLTGMTLPMISYGGTSLVFVLGSVGVLLNISRQVKL
jgi:cell division protein FtsW